MQDAIRQTIEEQERRALSPFAQLSSESAGREREEPQDPIRTCYMRDRDRILHSKSFRRLKHKTQVFIDPQGDHYRTRLTHTLEVAQIARTISRALRLNEDLTEAIALGHDVGHTPFGHAGESALDEVLGAMSAGTEGQWGQGTSGPPQATPSLRPSVPSSLSPTVPSSFRHYEQSLRVLDVLENLNLSQEVRQGVGGHSKGRKDLTDADGEPTSTLEAAVVRISDRIAYMNHDLDDAVRSGIISEIPARFQALGPTQGKRIGAMVEDVVTNSLERPAVVLSPAMLTAMNDLKEWLFLNVYEQYPVVYPDIAKAKRMVKDLFAHFLEPGNLPEGYQGIQGAVDYVAGMTDRFAIDTYVALNIPSEFRVL
ncbi:MAG: HD domain-containing protein [Armatimonadetes bacterium]|nr:HD domain-containing protein [Armatimonadota bacterium]